MVVANVIPNLHVWRRRMDLWEVQNIFRANLIHLDGIWVVIIAHTMLIYAVGTML